MSKKVEVGILEIEETKVRKLKIRIRFTEEVKNLLLKDDKYGSWAEMLEQDEDGRFFCYDILPETYDFLKEKNRLDLVEIISDYTTEDYYNDVNFE